MRFWLDDWLGGILGSTFSLFFALARDKEVTVADSFSNPLDSGAFVVHLERNPNDLEINEYVSLV